MFQRWHDDTDRLHHILFPPVWPQADRLKGRKRPVDPLPVRPGGLADHCSLRIKHLPIVPIDKLMLDGSAQPFGERYRRDEARLRNTSLKH